WVVQPPAGIINALLVESPADPLGHAALHLALDVAWMDGATDVLECGVAQNGHLARLGIDLNIANVRSEPRPCTSGVNRAASIDRAACGACLGGDLRQCQRWELTGVGACRTSLAVIPGDGLGIDLPDFGRP